MAIEKDHELVVKFMSLYSELQEYTDDDPSGLEASAESDESVKEICLEVLDVASRLRRYERLERSLFAGPVNPQFIKKWRDFDGRYAIPVGNVYLADLGFELFADILTSKPSLERKIEAADANARYQANQIEEVISFADEQASDESRSFPEDYVDELLAGVVCWERLRSQAGLDLRGIMRRRSLVPFVLIPRHVDRHHGETEVLSLRTLLLQAQEAFVYGVPFAALALMRSILEITLSIHYGASVGDLETRIKDCTNLPRTVPKAALHRLRRLANDVLHHNREQVQLPKEVDMVVQLNLLRKLIEEAPERIAAQRS